MDLLIVSMVRKDQKPHDKTAKASIHSLKRCVIRTWWGEKEILWRTTWNNKNLDESLYGFQNEGVSLKANLNQLSDIEKLLSSKVLKISLFRCYNKAENDKKVKLKGKEDKVYELWDSDVNQKDPLSYRKKLDNQRFHKVVSIKINFKVFEKKVFKLSQDVCCKSLGHSSFISCVYVLTIY